jgi:hypothetical protein
MRRKLLRIDSGDEPLGVDSSNARTCAYDETRKTNNKSHTCQPPFSPYSRTRLECSLVCWWRNYPAATEALWIPRGPSYHASFVINNMDVVREEKRGNLHPGGLEAPSLRSLNRCA